MKENHYFRLYLFLRNKYSKEVQIHFSLIFGQII